MTDDNLYEPMHTYEWLNGRADDAHDVAYRLFRQDVIEYAEHVFGTMWEVLKTEEKNQAVRQVGIAYFVIGMARPAPSESSTPEGGER